jgi:hypothetical protein
MNRLCRGTNNKAAARNILSFRIHPDKINGNVKSAVRCFIGSNSWNTEGKSISGVSDAEHD